MTGNGEEIPHVDLWVMEQGQPVRVSSWNALGQGRVVLFAVPGAFTPGCSNVHLPGYVDHADELSAKNVDVVACLAVNDPWVLNAWSQSQGAEGKILMLSDSNGEWTRALGMEVDTSARGLGPMRSKRYVAIIEDGVITHLDIDRRGAIEATTCEAVLKRL